MVTAASFAVSAGLKSGAAPALSEAATAPLACAAATLLCCIPALRHLQLARITAPLPPPALLWLCSRVRLWLPPGVTLPPPPPWLFFAAGTDAASEMQKRDAKKFNK